MKPLTKPAFLFALSLLGSSALLVACAVDSTVDPGGPSGNALRDGTGVEWVVDVDPDTGTAELAFPRSPLAPLLGSGSDAAGVAARFLAQYPSVFGVQVASELEPEEVTKDSTGAVHVVLVQRAGGQKVEDAPIAVHFDARGAVHHVTGPFYPGLDALVVAGGVSAADASSAAKTRIERVVPGATVVVGTIVTGVRLDENTPRYVHTVSVTANRALWEVWVDVKTGDVVRHAPRHHDVAASGAGVRQQRSFEIDEAKNGTYGLTRTAAAGKVGLSIYAASTEQLIVSKDPNVWEANAPAKTRGLAVEAYYKFDRILGWWKSELGWNSFDNKGTTLDVLVGGTEGGPTNASWAGDHIEVNEGTDTVPPAVDIDTMGHELTHAVVDFTAKLRFSQNCGEEYDAMNEGISDVFGELVAAGTVGGDRAVLSDEFGADAIIRSLEDPAFRKGKPGPNASKGADHMSVRQGECHADAGVIDLAWYLMTYGGSHPDPKRNFTLQAAPLGLDASRKLWWQLLRHELRGTKAIAVMARRTLLAAKNAGIPVEAPACAWMAVGALGAEELSSKYGVSCTGGTDAGAATDAGSSGDAAPLVDSCDGRSDGTYCSEVDPRASFQCAGNQNTGARYCLEGQRCAASGNDVVCR